MVTAIADKNVEKKTDFNQVCVWPGCTLEGSTPEQFEAFMLGQFEVRLQFLEEIKKVDDTAMAGDYDHLIATIMAHCENPF